MKSNPRQIFVIVLFSALIFITLRPVTDPDFWWHLKTGQLISQTQQIPKQDPFSYTALGKPWTTHEWLSELMIFKIFQAGSFAALILTFSLIITAAYLLVYLRCPGSSRPYIAGFALIIGAAASAPLWGVRPQMITLLFFSLFLYLLERYRQEQQLRFLIPLPLLMLVWVNLHGGYILGLGVMGVYIAGAVIELIWQATHAKTAIRETFRPVLTLTGMFIGSVLAALINPNGVRILTYPFETLTDPAMHAFIQEWFPPDFRELMWLPLALLIAGIDRQQHPGSSHPVDHSDYVGPDFWVFGIALDAECPLVCDRGGSGIGRADRFVPWGKASGDQCEKKPSVGSIG